MTAAAGFFILTLLFAVFIWISGLRQPECIGGVSGGHSSSDFFSDAFILSWTTFSTVGYGLIYSGISADSSIADIRVCTAITILVSLEAFVGVLFGSMCGAVLFIKVSRVQSFAQVTFGEIICIRYGSGLLAESDDDDNGTAESLSSADDRDFYPSPILELRVANRLHSIKGGEIIDATVNLVASIDASQVCTPVRTISRGRKRSGTKKIQHTRTLSDESTDSSVVVARSSQKKVRNLHRTSALHEDPTGHFVPKRIMSKLECWTHDHPFFKRVFVLQHTLDHTSPLLTPDARQRVRLANGLWPKDMATAHAVRNALYFDHLLVSLSGTSNADAKSVYAQTVYEFADVHVGYSFVNMLYRDTLDGSLKVDIDLINDVVEQTGGGGEPLQRRNGPRVSEVPVL